jgi:hypothetical protein
MNTIGKLSAAVVLVVGLMGTHFGTTAMARGYGGSSGHVHGGGYHGNGHYSRCGFRWGRGYPLGYYGGGCDCLTSCYTADGCGSNYDGYGRRFPREHRFSFSGRSSRRGR